MREIKFKILKIDLHSFLYDEGRTILEIGIEDLGAIRHNPKNYLFIQYTGLKDKKNQEIYEGDVVKRGKPIREGYFGKESLGVIKLYNGYFNWNGILLYSIVNNFETKVIGNIYENPDIRLGEIND